MAGLNGNRIALNTNGATPLADTVGGAAGTVTGAERARLQALSTTSDVIHRSVTVADDGTVGSGRINVGDDAYIEDTDTQNMVAVVGVAGRGRISLENAAGSISEEVLTYRRFQSANIIGGAANSTYNHGLGIRPDIVQVFVNNLDGTESGYSGNFKSTTSQVIIVNNMTGTQFRIVAIAFS